MRIESQLCALYEYMGELEKACDKIGCPSDLLNVEVYEMALAAHKRGA